MRRAAGFTLLEVMVAIAILGAALSVIVQANTRNVAAANHARLMTSASLLARAELVRIADDLDESGFPEQDDVRSGTFADEGHPNFRWEARIEKIELPSDLGAQAQKMADQGKVAGGAAGGAADKATQSAGGFNSNVTGSGGAASLIFSQFDIIRSAIEQSIRKVTVEVAWMEGKQEKSIDVSTFITDPSRVDIAVPGLGALPQGGLPGTPGAGARPGTSPTTPGTTPQPLPTPQTGAIH